MLLNKASSKVARILKTPPWLFILPILLLLPLSASSTPIVDLKVLVITTGTAEQDQGLDLIDDMLDEMGVPYDVLDATQTELTDELLVTNGQGNYNGIILTDSSLYYLGNGNVNGSAFTLEEWKRLHAYERDFKVRESVLSGYPMSGEYFRVTYDLDYGMDMNSLVAGFSYTGVWQLPINNNDIFEYVNKANTLPITDYTIITTPSLDPNGPAVTPLLTDKASGKIMVSKLIYNDGREVLFSSITNAWYLIYSQLLNYEFLNFATQGVFIGSRQVYLAAHIDDLYLAEEIWDPLKNITNDYKIYRNTANDIENIVAANNQFNSTYSNLTNFKLDMVFNGAGASVNTPAKVILESISDTYISSERQSSSYAESKILNINNSSTQQARALVTFELPDNVNNLSSKAVLKLRVKAARGEVVTGTGRICLIQQKWEDQANWTHNSVQRSWINTGGDFDPSSCISYTIAKNRITANITSLVNQWQQTNIPKAGLMIMADADQAIQIYSTETRQELRRPRLIIRYTSQEPLTDTITKYKNNFRFLNHTFSHRDMYKSSGATYDIAFQEISDNLILWLRLNLPGFTNASQVLVTGNHSGLEDSESSNEASSIFVDYPEGRNTELFESMATLGIRYMASDISRPNQNIPSYVPDTNILLLPRYPTSLFYNVTTPEELTDEYNYIFYERHIEAGDNPCHIAGAICQPRNYNGILAAEAETTFRHMLTFSPSPHYFHISNLHDYDNGLTLQYDWLHAVTDYFNQLLTLPIINLDYYSIGVMTEEKLAAKSANLRGTWNRDNNSVTLFADDAIKARATGITGGIFYGGQRLITTDVDHNGRTFTVDQADK